MHIRIDVQFLYKNKYIDITTHLVNYNRPSAGVKVDITQRLVGCLRKL